MFVLVEAQCNLCASCMVETGKCVLLECIEAMPDLGVAYLLASLKHNNIKTQLVRGSTRYLKEVLVTDSNEFLEILCHEGWSVPRCLDKTVKWLQNLIYEYGERWFKNHLRKMYEIITSKNLGTYLNTLSLKYSKDIINCILSLYGTYIIQKDGKELSIVKRLYEEIRKLKPDIVGFSIKAHVGIFGDPIFRTISQLIKDELDIPIIIGGQFTSGQPVEWIESFLTMYLKNIDYVIRGNADQSLPKLILSIEAGKVPRDIPNLTYREDGKIMSTKFEWIKNVNDLPIPDFSQFYLDAYAAPVRILPMLTARGCPWRKCAFCSHYMVYGDYYAPLSVDKVIETIKEYRDYYKTHFIIFNDETLPSERASEISKNLLKEKIDDVFIYTYGRMDEGYTRELLDLMYKAGFRVIFWGLESGSQKILDNMNKGIRVEIASRILKDSYEVGMLNFCFIMMGFPGEEREDVMETFKFLNMHRKYVDLISLNLFTFSETSPVGRNPEKWGVIRDGSRYGYHVDKGLQPEEVEALAKELYKKVPLMVSDRFIRWWQFGVLPDPYWRYLLFVFHSMNLLDNYDVKKLITKKGMWHSLYPVFTGHLLYLNFKKAATQTFWEKEPKKCVFLNNLKYMFCVNANGVNSFDKIVNECKKIEKLDYRNYVEEEIINFVQELIDNDLIVFIQPKN